MYDQRAFDALDAMVQELHDREVPRRVVLRVLGVAFLVSELLLRGSSTLGFAMFVLVILGCCWYEESREDRYGSEMLSTINVIARTNKWVVMIRSLYLGIALATVVVHFDLLGLANAVLYLMFFYGLYTIVPHEPPKKRRAPKAVVAHEAG